MSYYVYSHCFNGSRCTVSHNFTGTRGACRRFIKGRGNHGFYFITTIDHPDKVARRYGP